MPLSMQTYDFRPRVAVCGAGQVGLSLALRYVDEFAQRDSQLWVGALPSPQGEFRQPPILVVIWHAADKSAEREFRPSLQHLDRDPGLIVLGICVGGTAIDGCGFKVLSLPDYGQGDRTLAAALDCIVEMVLRPNLVNLRIHELREVLKQGSILQFAVGWGEGETCLEAALHSALAKAELEKSERTVRGIWMHASASKMPAPAALWNADQALRLRCGESAIVWSGATASPSVRSGARVSLLMALSPEADDR